MANGGIIGPVQTASCQSVSANNVAFTSNGTYNKTGSYPGAGATVMIVAGGGGSAGEHGGGGGAGGLRILTCQTVSSGTTVTIGGGGAGRFPGSYAGGDGAAGYATITANGVTTPFTSSGTITLTG